MKTYKYLVMALFCSGALASTGQADDGREGNGSIYLEGFKDYAAESASLKTAINSAIVLIDGLKLNTKEDFPELSYVRDEILSSRYILVPNDIVALPNRKPGDYPIGGYLLASTETYRGAPTKIYPKLIKDQSESQLVQMVIHEALHRALPEPMNSFEGVVERLTNILTQYTTTTIEYNLKSYFEIVRTKKMPWFVRIERSATTAWEHVAITTLIEPLSEDNILVQTTAEQSRIKISVAIQVLEEEASIQIIVMDTYRQLAYSSANAIRGKDQREMHHTLDSYKIDARKFIRASIKKIEDDLKWQ